MVVDDFHRTVESGSYEVSARIRRDGDGEEFRLFYRFPDEYAPVGELDASPFLPPALVWCLRHSEALTIDGPVSPRLLGELDEIIGVYRSLFPASIHGPVGVSAEAHQPSPGRALTASLFTRGVDSWFAVLTALEDPRLRPPITHVVYAPGFNAPGWSAEMREAKAQATARAAAAVGLELIRFESNINRHFGRGIFGIALSLGFTTALIPSGNMRGEIERQGTHPALDPRYSTERTGILHYGDASRLQKVERVAQSQPALDTLRVCRYDHLETDRNCGKCEKCLRTMLELHAVGALERCRAFEEPLEVSKVAAVRDLKTMRHSWIEVLHALGDDEFDRQLGTAIRLVIFRNDLRFAARRADGLAERAELESVVGDPASALWKLDRELQRRISSAFQDRDDDADATGRLGVLRRLLAGSDPSSA
jgi:hypothetical protein